MASSLENNLKVSVGDENRTGTPLGGQKNSDINTPHSSDNRRDFSNSGGDRRSYMGKRRPFGRGNYHGNNRNGPNFSRLFDNSNRNNQGYHSGGDHHRSHDNYKNPSTNTPSQLHGQQSMNVDNSPSVQDQSQSGGNQYQTPTQTAGYVQPTYTQQAYQAFYPSEYEQHNYYMAQQPYIPAPPQYSIFPGCKCKYIMFSITSNIDKIKHLIDSIPSAPATPNSMNAMIIPNNDGNSGFLTPTNSQSDGIMETTGFPYMPPVVYTPQPQQMV